MIADPNGRLLPINTWRQFVWGAVLSAAGRENPLCVQILLICPIHPLGCSMILPMMTIYESDDNSDGGGDIYIMMQCLFVCVSQKSSLPPGSFL